MTDKDSDLPLRSYIAVEQQWDEIIRQAWRPAWSIRSRKGCLAPFITWWRERHSAADAANRQPRQEDQ